MMIFPFDESLTKQLVDALLAGKRPWISVHAAQEFNWAVEYLDKLGYEFDSWLDNPEEAIIENVIKKRSES